MSDSYYFLWYIVTNMLPSIALTLLFPAITIGIAAKFMRNL